MIIKENIQKELPLDINDLSVVSDFDRTLTGHYSVASWDAMAVSGVLDDEFQRDKDELYDYYRPIEIDETIPLQFRHESMREWVNSHVMLFKKYKITREMIMSVANDSKLMTFRNGAPDFIELFHRYNAPFVVLSAGLEPFIKGFLRVNGCLFPNILVKGNNIRYEAEEVAGIHGETLHCFNKNIEIFGPTVRDVLMMKDRILLLGDQISDTKMVSSEKVIKIGFYTQEGNLTQEEFSEHFDIVCQEGEDYKSLIKTLF